MNYNRASNLDIYMSMHASRLSKSQCNKSRTAFPDKLLMRKHQATKQHCATSKRLAISNAELAPKQACALIPSAQGLGKGNSNALLLNLQRYHMVFRFLYFL